MDHQSLIFEGQILEDNRRIKEYGIGSESVVRLMPLDKPFTCLICHKGFQSEGDLTPHGLLCGHSFCNRDIRALVGDGVTIACPVRCMETDLNVCTGGFPMRNIALLESSNQSREIWGEMDGDLEAICSNCDPGANQKIATVFCADCSADLCDECDPQVHALRVFRSHQRTQITSNPRRWRSARCTESL